MSELAAAPYDAAEFPFQFLAAFDKKETTLKRLHKGDTNKSDVLGAVLLINSIHLARTATKVPPFKSGIYAIVPEFLVLLVPSSC